MPTARQFTIGVLSVDVLLFVVASAMNDHSNTSVDGIVWWAALFLFGVLIVIGTLGLGRFLVTHRRRPKRIRAR